MAMCLNMCRLMVTMLLVGYVLGKSIEHVDKAQAGATSVHADHSNNQVASHSSQQHDLIQEDPFDHFNRCVMSCAHCGKTESPYFVEEENDELVLTCANSCVYTTNYHDILYHLLVKNLFTRSFARCFVHQMTNTNFEFKYDLD